MSDDNNLPALMAELERLGTEAQQWAGVAASDSTALVHVGSNDPEKVREQMVAVRAEARAKTKELQAAADQVKREVEAVVDAQRRELDRQRREMQAQMNAALAALEPLKLQVKQMEEGIWTVNLYLGTSEEIVTLRTGEPAPADTPITLRTSVLAMDEEVAAFPAKSDGSPDWQGMDHGDIELFDGWLSDPEHLAQVLPEPRGMVVLRPRRTTYTYSEDETVEAAMLNAAMNEENFKSYFLIRNGDNLYRMRTNFQTGDYLMPVASEFTSLFTTTERNHKTGEYETVEIRPGSPAWAKAEEAQDARRRHYMRVGLILQGLLDRTDVFEPLPFPLDSMNQRTYDNGHIVVLDDTDKAIGTGREPYYDWIKRVNLDLRPGMRIIGTFRGEEWDETACRDYDFRRTSGNDRLSPTDAERPPHDTLLTIEDRRDFGGTKGLVVRYQRTEKVYDSKMWVPAEGRPGWGYRGGYRTPKRRASAVILPGDITIIPFDLVTEAEMQEYLDARTERHAYADSFPLLQSAIAMKAAEREAEAPFRDLLVRVLADDTGREPVGVEADIDDLIHRFKVGSKWHRPLVSMTAEDEAKAIRLIRAEYKRIATSGATEVRDAAAVKALREHDETVMFVGRLSSGKYVAFAPQPRRENGEPTNLFVTEYTTGKTVATIKAREWIAPGVRAGRMTSLFEAEAWATWDRLSSPKDRLTDDEFDALLVDAESRALRAVTARGALHSDVMAVGTLHTDKRHPVVVVYVSDGSKPITERVALADDKPTVDYYAVMVTWKRASDGSVGVEVGTPDQRSWSWNHGWSGNDHKAGPEMPWERGLGYSGKRPTVVRRYDDAIEAALAACVAARKVNAERDRVKRSIRIALDRIERQQVDEQIAVIKAKFLAEYPDEDMWTERERELTKGVKAAIQPLNDNDHWAEKYNVRKFEGGGYSYNTRPRTDARSLEETLARLVDAGIDWEGLTVANVYALDDRPVPADYEPIVHLVCASQSTAGEHDQ